MGGFAADRLFVVAGGGAGQDVDRSLRLFDAAGIWRNDCGLDCAADRAFSRGAFRGRAGDRLSALLPAGDAGHAAAFVLHRGRDHR